MPLGDLYASLTPAPFAVPISDGSSSLNAWVSNGSSSGTVTSVSIGSANGFTGTVLDPTTTPFIEIGTSVSGILFGDGTGVAAAIAANFPTLNQNTTGSAATLTTPRAIYGNNFDGSAALTQIIASTFGGTGNGFTKFSGPTTAEKTFTLPDANATLAIASATLTADQVVVGNGTAALKVLAAGTDTHVLTMVGGVPAWAAASSGGTPGGSTTQLQYNNAGAFGGISGATTNGTATTFTASNLIATSPRFITSLNDTNGNEVIGITATGSAVNEFTLINAATGNAPSMSATGGDTNINILLAPKGSGNVTLNGTNPTHVLALSGTNKSIWGVATGANSLVTGSATDDTVIRNVASQAFLVSVDNGTSIAFNLTNAGRPTFTSTTGFQGLTLNTPGTGTIRFVNFAANGVSLGSIGATDSAGGLITGSASGDMCSRTAAGAFLVSTDNGTTISFQVVASNGGVRTSTPSGGTAANWKFGIAASVSPTAPNRTIQLDVGGTLYYLHAKTTND